MSIFWSFIIATQGLNVEKFNIWVFVLVFFLIFFIQILAFGTMFETDEKDRTLIIDQNKIIYEEEIVISHKPVDKNKRKTQMKILFSDIASIQLLLDASKEKPVYKREYLAGAENNWLIIKLHYGIKYEKYLFIRNNEIKYKYEILLKSLKEEETLINFLENIKKSKNIQVSYGKKNKGFYYAIMRKIRYNFL